MAWFSQKAFDRSGSLIQRASKSSEATFGPLVKRLTPVEAADNLDWAGDADWARLQQDPLRARGLLRIVAGALIVMVVWAAFAPVDEITRGEARVVPTTQVQIIQSVDGGVVESLLVKEGQIVEAGQMLLRVDPTRFVSNMLESRASQTALQAKALRLEALTRGTPFNPPAELKKEAPDVVAQEMRLYESRRAEISAQTSIYQNQLVQRQQELNEVRARREQAERSLELMTKELNATRPMVATGAVSEVEVLRLEREVARLRGDREQAGAQISRVQSAILEATSKINEVQLTGRNAMSAELSETMSKLASMTQGGRALEDKVKHADIKSPVRGTVKRLLVNTVGAVVQPGKEVVEVVPLDDALILEVQIAPKDIGFLRPEQEAMVKFSAYDFSIYGGLAAQVFLIGADSVLDEKGNAFYHVRVRTTKTSLGPNLPIIPGMVAQVDIMTGKKTVLSYLLKPVLRAKATALTER
ncbi:MAG: HlyD family type I secretion periplasmic adaptor subunit [Comamonadaceae bacterium]|nr:HlyD family type I secretion periplasmic adaptor subunit [Comamonadaceae bacterium]